VNEHMLDVVDPVAFGGGLAAIIFFGTLGCLALGRRLGKWALSRAGHDGLHNVGSLENAVFALLGLLIAFTFSGALNRFDTRRAQAVDEVNAIGTAWLRVDLLPAPAQPAMRDTMRRYVDARIATYKSLPDVEAAKAGLARSLKLQSEIWTQTVAALRSPETVPGAQFLVPPALNAMFDITTVRVVATQIHPPGIVYWMLAGLALVSALLAGYQSASEKAPTWLHQIGFAAIVALTVYVILDIEFPRLGWVRLDAIDQLLVAQRASMQ